MRAVNAFKATRTHPRHSKDVGSQILHQKMALMSVVMVLCYGVPSHVNDLDDV